METYKQYLQILVRHHASYIEALRARDTSNISMVWIAMFDRLIAYHTQQHIQARNKLNSINNQEEL